MQPPQKKTLLQRWKDSIGGWPLLGKIVAWVVLAILAFAAVMCCLWHLTLDPGEYVASIAATSLTIVGGVGAVAYLVIKYQERQQAGRDEERAKREECREEDRLVNTKMQDAVDQLGSDRASTRIAGVYALTDVADTYGGGYRQRVVDILCGYLRSDRETYPLSADGKPATDQPRSGDSDKAVESTIIAVMRNHLLKERKADNGEIRVRQIVRDDQLWCDCAFDLHGVTFHEYVDLMDITSVRGLNFNRSKFEDHINFPAESFCDAAIGVDNYDGMSKAVRLLKSLGHQRIAFVVDYIPDDMVYSTSQRMEAFLEAAEQNGYDDEYAYVITADEHDAPLSKADLAAQLVAKLLSLPHMPTAICAETDQVAIAVIKELGKQQLHVPEDISVIGFDDADIAQAANLTTVRQNPLEMGRNAARKTLSLLRGQTPDASYESQEATLMLRDTTRRVATDRS